jgi:5-formyltetrahydrofolate cyclo-ligase
LPADRKRKSRAIISSLIKSPKYKNAKVVALYLSFGSEVETGALVQRAWRDKKTVLIPNTRHGLHRPSFHEYRRKDVLHKTKFGPHEHAHPPKAFDLRKVDLVVVPGLAFDSRGHRLGYGGGTYDRILAKTSRAKHVGLFFSIQKLVRIPDQNHDQRLDGLIAGGKQ